MSECIPVQAHVAIWLCLLFIVACIAMIAMLVARYKHAVAVMIKMSNIITHLNQSQAYLAEHVACNDTAMESEKQLLLKKAQQEYELARVNWEEAVKLDPFLDTIPWLPKALGLTE